MAANRFAALWVLVFAGCTYQEPPPSLPPTIKISGRVYTVPELEIKGLDKVDVPLEEIEAFLRLVAPHQKIQRNIRADQDHHVADIYLYDKGAKETKIIVRWTGHNPAAVSTDGIHYYYARTDEFPDGAIRIARLLWEFSNRPTDRALRVLLDPGKRGSSGMARRN